MSDKISPVAVVREAFHEIVEFKATFGLFILAMCIVTLIAAFMAMYLQERTMQAVLIVTPVLKWIVSSLFLTLGFHFFLVVPRGYDDLFPGDFLASG